MTSQMEGKSMPSSTSNFLRQRELDGAARDVADVALEVGVAANDLQTISGSHDSDRQHTRRMNQLARNIDGHVADGFSSGNSFLPFPHGAERIVVVQLLHSFQQYGEFRAHTVTPE